MKGYCVGTLRQTAENALALMTDCLANLFSVSKDLVLLALRASLTISELQTIIHYHI